MDSSNVTACPDVAKSAEANATEAVSSVQNLPRKRSEAESLSKQKKVLTQAEARELERLETTVERGLKAFWEIGLALRQIREQRLYRQGYGTFEDYCMSRWQIARRSAYQLIAAAQVYENVRHGAQILPANERQVRPLVALPSEQQQQAWVQAVSTAPQGKVTAAHVLQVVKEYKQRGTPSGSGNAIRTDNATDSFLTSAKTSTSRTDTEEAVLALAKPDPVPSCWNCRHCSREVLEDPQSFYCYQFGKLNFIEKDGNRRGAECPSWTSQGTSEPLRKTQLSKDETFTLLLQLPASLQALIQDAARAEGLVVVDWVTNVLTSAISSHELVYRGQTSGLCLT